MRLQRPAPPAVTFVIDAEVARIAALDASIEKEFPDPKDCKRARAYLAHPTLRPLLELDLNGATSLTGARILKSWGFIERDQYRVRFGDITGFFMEAVRLTRAGHDELNELSPKDATDPVFEKIIAAVTSYVAIDEGAGIVARRELIDFAVNYCDTEILSNLVELHTGMQQHPILPFNSIVSEKERLEGANEYWCGLAEERAGAVFIDLSNLPAGFDVAG
jgi:hypothetical protein